MRSDSERVRPAPSVFGGCSRGPASETEIGQSGVAIRTTTKRPPIPPVRFPDGKIIDARQPQSHEAVRIELPILVAVRSVPMSRIVVPLVGETHGDAMSFEGPQLFDQAIVQLLRPLACKKRDDLLPSAHEFCAVSPAGIDRVGQRHLLRIARIPGIFRQTDLLDGCLPSKWRQWRPGHTVETPGGPGADSERARRGCATRRGGVSKTGRADSRTAAGRSVGTVPGRRAARLPCAAPA